MLLTSYILAPPPLQSLDRDLECLCFISYPRNTIHTLYVHEWNDKMFHKHDKVWEVKIWMSIEKMCNYQGFHRHWKSWKNETTFSSQGILKKCQKVGEFCQRKKEGTLTFSPQFFKSFLNWKKEPNFFSFSFPNQNMSGWERLSQSLWRLLTHKIRRSCRLPESFTGSGKNVPFWSHWKRKFLRRALWDDSAIRNHNIPAGQPTMNQPNIDACAHRAWPLTSQRVDQCLWRGVKVKKVMKTLKKFQGKSKFNKTKRWRVLLWNLVEICISTFGSVMEIKWQEVWQYQSVVIFHIRQCFVPRFCSVEFDLLKSWNFS